MKIVGALFGLLILAVVFVLWLRTYKSIKGDDGPLFSLGNRKPRKENNSLDEFLAAYKRGEVPMGNSASIPVNAATKPSRTPLPAPAAAQTAPIKRDAFVSGSTKLAYLACKTGLRDHHIFAHVSLSALSTGGMVDPVLARTGVDLLICNANMSAVAVIDLIDAGNSAADAAKADYLKALGIRYLRLSAKSLPRPDELHALLYKM
ncbi:MAG: DUF2726 domain-containing protein [Betaproteobacteria bacterium]|nr:DUF2726 domain-containing protein [Betaproteobacteria bacterium]